MERSFSVRAHVTRLAAGFGLALLLAQSSLATSASTYDFASLANHYRGAATSATGTFSTNQMGTYDTAAAIEEVLNAATFEAALYDGTGAAIARLDNATAYWVVLGDAKLVVTPTTVSLALYTPRESSDGRLMLRQNNWGHWVPGEAPFSVNFIQSNNVFDQNGIMFDHNAMDVAADWSRPYGSVFNFAAVSAVPEPSTRALLGLGLICLVLSRCPRVGLRQTPRDVITAKD